MSWLVDLIVVALVVAFGFAGWALGLIRACLAFAGLVIGAILTSVGVIPLLQGTDMMSGLKVFFAVAALVLLCAIGLAVGDYCGRRLTRHERIAERRTADRVAGAAVGVVVASLFAWAVGTTVVAYPNRDLHDSVAGSVTLSSINVVVPSGAEGALTSAQSLLTRKGVPQVFGGIGLSEAVDTPLPATTDVRTPAVEKSLRSVVRVYGVATKCGVGHTGSGWVWRPGRVMTNAHVVAGIDDPKVEVPGLPTPLSAKVVLFDPRADVAVLTVPGLTAAVLQTSPGARPGDPGMIAGYPDGGPLQAVPARVQAVYSDELGLGTDIYGEPGISRRVLLLGGVAIPGNSGGPFLDPDGRVAGLMFAEAVRGESTSFALTVEDFTAAAAQGEAAVDPVDTGPCQ